jgi:protein ImuB
MKMKSYVVLLVPEFRLQATVRYSPGVAEKPVALLEVDRSKSRVSELNSRARIYQVQRGMTPTQALARCPELHLIRGNEGHERSAQEALLQTAEGLSPYLESTGPGIVTVELPGERLFRKEDFMERLVVPLQSLGLEVQAGVACTPDLALLAARFADSVKIVSTAAAFLAPLPISALQPVDDLQSVLESWGIHTVGQFLKLPSAQVWERLGPEAVQFGERARGGCDRPLKLIKPREFFAEVADLEHAVETLEPLLFLLRRFLEQIAARLANVHLVAGKLRLVLRFEQGEPYGQDFTIPQPTRDVNLLFRMLHTHLENFTAEWPIVGLELAAKPVRPHAEQFGLFEQGLRDPHQFAETLARLQALLGSSQVGTPELEPSHHPDAFHLRPYDLELPPPVANGEILIGLPWLRFSPPAPADIAFEEARPAFLRSARSTGPIKEAYGPWKLEGNWWEKRHWSREEWDIATEDGIYRLVRTEEKWFLDGIYA